MGVVSACSCVPTQLKFSTYSGHTVIRKPYAWQSPLQYMFPCTEIHVLIKYQINEMNHQVNFKCPIWIKRNIVFLLNVSHFDTLTSLDKVAYGIRSWISIIFCLFMRFCCDKIGPKDYVIKTTDPFQWQELAYVILILVSCFGESVVNIPEQCQEFLSTRTYQQLKLTRLLVSPSLPALSLYWTTMLTPRNIAGKPHANMEYLRNKTNVIVWVRQLWCGL